MAEQSLLKGFLNSALPVSCFHAGSDELASCVLFNFFLHLKAFTILVHESLGQHRGSCTEVEFQLAGMFFLQIASVRCCRI